MGPLTPGEGGRRPAPPFDWETDPDLSTRPHVDTSTGRHVHTSTGGHVDEYPRRHVRTLLPSEVEIRDLVQRGRRRRAD